MSASADAIDGYGNGCTRTRAGVGLGGTVAKHDDLAVLQAIPLFSGLSLRDLKVVRRQLQDETFRAGQSLVSEGDPGGRMYIIRAGRVKVVVSGRTRRTEGSGAIIGELSVLDRGPRTATVVAEGLVDAWSMSSTTFLSILTEYPSIARAVLRSMATKLRETDKSLTS